MTDLDRRLGRLRAEAHAWASEMRDYALKAEADPGIVQNLMHLPAYHQIARLQIPPSHNPEPLVLDGERYYIHSALERTICSEEAAWGDLGMMLAAPGGSMSSVLISVLGDDEQQEWFYGWLRAAPRWTCFALTEPDRGSDASGARTRCTPRQDGGLVVEGVKRYVSNAMRASYAVVFGRTGPGPLGVVAAIVDTSDPGFTVEPIRTAGVRAAQLGAITLDSVEVPPERVLGRHLSPIRRGMWGWLRTFNVLRPTVAAMAVGVARAAHEYVVAERRTLSSDERDRLDRMGRRIAVVRQLTRTAAARVDADPGDGHLASAAKVSAARLAEDITLEALTFFGPGARLDHPVLEKLARDARSLEFMEGTGDIQKLSVATTVTRRPVPGPREAAAG